MLEKDDIVRLTEVAASTSRSGDLRNIEALAEALFKTAAGGIEKYCKAPDKVKAPGDADKSAAKTKRKRQGDTP